MAGHDAARVGLLDAGEQAQEGRLPGAVEAEDDHARAAVDGEVEAGEDFEGPVRFRQPDGGQRRAPARRRIREPQIGDLVGLPLRLQPGEQTLRAALHVLRGGRLRRLGPHFVRLPHERARLALRVQPLAAAAFLIRLALFEILGPRHVVHIEGGAIGVQMPHGVDRLVQQLRRMGDRHEPARERAEVIAKPQDRIVVEVVGRLVQQKSLSP